MAEAECEDHRDRCPVTPRRALRPEWMRLDGERLRHLRVMKMWTQETLARKAGVSLGTVWRLERAPDARCRCSTASRIANALGEDLTSLIRKPDGASGYVAFWSRRQWHRVAITDLAGNVVELLPVSQQRERPGTELLRQASWSVYAGAEWREEHPGEWSVPVFGYQQLRRGGDRDDPRSGCR